MKTLVVGAGAMGRWLGEALRSETDTLAFLDSEPDSAQAAAKALDGVAVTDRTVERYDLVCFAVPIPVAPEVIAAYAERSEQAVIDVTGRMDEPIEAMREHAPDCERASFHPLFAPENEPGNVPVVVDESGPTVEQVIEVLQERGNEVFETTVSRHDEAMETVQARTHAAILAFGLSASTVPEEFQTPISAALAELTEQVTGGESRVYADIQSAFEGASDVANAAEEIANADRERFEQLYRDARLQPDDAGDHPERN